MKIVQWDDDTIPEVAYVDDGYIVVEDGLFEWNLEEHDLIQYWTELGTECYLVVKVDRDEESRLTLATIERAVP